MKKILSITLSLIITCSVLFTFGITAEAASVNVKYSVHLQDIGWQSQRSNGSTAGSTGEFRRIEAIKISVSGLKDGSVQYRTHIQNNGWQSWKSSGTISGTTGKALRAEAIQIKLTGSYASKYDIVYRVHVQNFGWLSWTKNGGTAGTTNMSYRMEAIQIKLVKKGSFSTSGIASKTTPDVSYSAHSQDIGWQSSKYNGATAGTTGKSKQMEAIKISCKNFSGKECIKYSVHIQDIGWQNWTSNNAIAGTTGMSKRMEAIKISLDNSMSPYFDVYYRVHISNYGWLSWTKNGSIAGSTGISTPIEAIQIRVVSNADTSISTNGTAYINTSTSNKQTLNKTAVLNYANTYWNKRNYNYNYYTNNNCCNFVSQCLVAGGLSTNSTFRNGTPAFVYIPNFKSYMQNNLGVRYIPSPSASQIEVGDVIMTSSSHVMIVTRKEGNRIYANGNTNNRCQLQVSYFYGVIKTSSLMK